MTAIDVARQCDSVSKPVEAAWAYEIALTEEDATIETVFDVVAIYASANDFGFAAAHRLDKRFVDFSYYRAIDVLEGAGKRFGPHPDLRAWRIYLDDLVGVAEMDLTEVALLASQENGSFARLLDWIQRGRRGYEHAPDALFSWASGADTQRKRFFLSFSPASSHST